MLTAQKLKRKILWRRNVTCSSVGVQSVHDISHGVGTYKSEKINYPSQISLTGPNTPTDSACLAGKSWFKAGRQICDQPIKWLTSAACQATASSTIIGTPCKDDYKRT